MVNFNSCHCPHGYSLIYTHSLPKARKEKIFTLPIRYNSAICLKGLEATLAESSGIYSTETMDRMLIASQCYVSKCINFFFFRRVIN